jgi:hypothetical protein
MNAVVADLPRKKKEDDLGGSWEGDDDDDDAVPLGEKTKRHVADAKLVEPGELCREDGHSPEVSALVGTTAYQRGETRAGGGQRRVKRGRGRKQKVKETERRREDDLRERRVHSEQHYLTSTNFLSPTNTDCVMCIVSPQSYQQLHLNHRVCFQ